MRNFGIGFVVWLILVAQDAKAQTPYLLGLKGGANLNSLYWNNLPYNVSTNTKSFISYHIGIFAKVQLSKKISIIPELQYIIKGFREVDQTSSAKAEFAYIDLPVLASFAVGKSLSLEAGPEFAYLSSLKVSTASTVIDITKSMNKFDTGITFGARYGLLPRLSVILRYAISIIPIASGTYQSSSGYTSEYTVHNQCLQLSLAYLSR